MSSKNGKYKYFHEPDKLENGVELIKDVYAYPIHIDKDIMVLKVSLYGDVPNHKHTNLQIGIVLNGKGRFRIGDEEKIVTKNIFYVIPSMTIHGVEVIEKPFEVIDIFIPPREDYIKLFKEKIG
jgi:mannose-6-phosphate isomerase-like protein (cupin superfamily)